MITPLPFYFTLMRRSVCTAHLTKEYIESKISQELIVSTYLDIPMEVVQHCIQYNQLIPSVFRDNDSTGSMGIQFNMKGRLKVRDFGGFGFFEDVYGVVAYVLTIICGRKIETNNKKDFYFILQHIAHTFSDIIDNKAVDGNIKSQIKSAIVAGKQRKTIIELVPRSWNQADKKVWNYWGITLDYLNTHFVLPVDQYYVDRTVDSDPKYYYKSKDPCYAYMLGMNRKGVSLIKLYFPLRNRNRDLKFITNCNVLEGLPNLELNNYDYILITKSSKDRLSIGCHLSRLPLYKKDGTQLVIGVINLPSENYRLKENEYAYLVNRLAPDGIILSLLDFDPTGRNGARYLRDTYNIPYLFITRGEFGLPNYHCKDFADLHDRYSNSQIDNFIIETKKYVELTYRRNDAYDSDAEV